MDEDQVKLVDPKKASEDHVIVITSDSGNSSNSPSESPIFEKSSTSQIISEDHSTVVFEKTVIEKSRSPTKNSKRRSNPKKTIKHTSPSSSSSVEFDFGGQSVIVQKLKSVSISEGPDQYCSENEEDQTILCKENKVDGKSPLPSYSESLPTTDLELDKLAKNDASKLLLEVKSPAVKSYDAPSLIKSAKNATKQNREPEEILKPEITQKVIVQGKLPPFMKKYKTSWLIGDPSESSKLVVSSKDTTDKSLKDFHNFTVGTIKGVKTVKMVKRYNTFAALGASNVQGELIPAIPGTSFQENKQLIPSTENSDDQSTTSNNPSVFNALRSKVREKLGRRNLTEEEKLLTTSEHIKQDDRDRSLKCKFVIGSLLAVLLIFLWAFAVYYTMPYSTSDANYNFTKNEHLFTVISTPMELPIKRVFLVVDDCRADEKCSEVINKTSPADFRSFQITAQKEVKEIYGFQLPITIKNRTTRDLPELQTINSFLRISFKCEAQGLSQYQTEALFNFLDDHVDFGDVAQNYSLILEENEVEGCELMKSELGLKNEFARHFVENLNITKLDMFTNNSTNIPKNVTGMVWSKIIFVQLSNKSLENWKNYPAYGINFLVNNKGRIFEHLGWSQILESSMSNIFRIVFWEKIQTNDKPSEKATKSAETLINYGIKLGVIDEKYQVIKF